MTPANFQRKADDLLTQLQKLFTEQLRSTASTLPKILHSIEDIGMAVAVTRESDLIAPHLKFVGIAGYDEGAMFAVSVFGILARPDQFENNVHLDVAEEIGRKLGIADVRVRFDEDDADGAPIFAGFVVPVDYKPLDISRMEDDAQSAQWLADWLPDPSAEGSLELLARRGTPSEELQA